MFKQSKRHLNLELDKKKTEFICEIGRKPLKECIEDDINLYHLDKKNSRIINEDVLNCLKAMLITCVGKDVLNFEANTSELNIIIQDKNEEEMEIIEMELTISLNEENQSVINKINECLKLYDATCIKNKNIRFSVNFKEDKSLGKYKDDLLKIKNELENILGREIPTD